MKRKFRITRLCYSTRGSSPISLPLEKSMHNSYESAWFYAQHAAMEDANSLVDILKGHAPYNINMQTFIDSDDEDVRVSYTTANGEEYPYSKYWIFEIVSDKIVNAFLYRGYRFLLDIGMKQYRVYDMNNNYVIDMPTLRECCDIVDIFCADELRLSKQGENT